VLFLCLQIIKLRRASNFSSGGVVKLSQICTFCRLGESLDEIGPDISLETSLHPGQHCERAGYAGDEHLPL
jgi:hypothetical protein